MSVLEGVAVWQPTEDNSWPRPWPKSVPRTPCPALLLNEFLRKRLRQIREYQMAEHLAGRPPVVCNVFYDEEVVRLGASCGYAAHLDTDGRVHYENFGERVDIEVLTDPRDVATFILRYASEIGLPELIDQPCPTCERVRLPAVRRHQVGVAAVHERLRLPAVVLPPLPRLGVDARRTRSGGGGRGRILAIRAR